MLYLEKMEFIIKAKQISSYLLHYKDNLGFGAVSYTQDQMTTHIFGKKKILSIKCFSTV